MKRSKARGRTAQLDRDIARAVARRKPPRSYHATIRECAAWEPESSIEPLTQAKRQSAAEFERCYLVNLMQRAGSVSEAARFAGLDRSNFKKLLQRHGLRSKD